MQVSTLGVFWISGRLVARNVIRNSALIDPQPRFSSQPLTQQGCKITRSCTLRQCYCGRALAVHFDDFWSPAYRDKLASPHCDFENVYRAHTLYFVCLSDIFDHLVRLGLLSKRRSSSSGSTGGTGLEGHTFDIRSRGACVSAPVTARRRSYP